MSRESNATSFASSGVLPSRQIVPAGSVAPTFSDVSSRLPASAGASQSEWSRVHSQVHATLSLSGSCPFGLKAAQPQDQTLAMCSSAETCFAASASHFVTSSQSGSGSPSRPPAPGVELKVSIIPIRFVGTPIWIRSSMRVRIVLRNRTLPATAPCFETDGPEK